MPISPLNPPLVDLGGFPVVWDSDVGTIEQDPTQGGTNMYAAGDLFRNPATGDIVQLQADGSLTFVRSGGMPAVPGAARVQSPAAIVPITAAGGGTPSSTNTAGSGAAINITGNPQGFVNDVIGWLGRSDWIGNVPNALIVAGGALGYTMLRQRRRR